MADFLPPSEFPIDRLARVFRYTTNSYKFYWFYAILDYLKSPATNEQVRLEDLLIRMVALAWYPINFFRISFGKRDQLGLVVQILKDRTELDRNASRQEVIAGTKAAIQVDPVIRSKVLELGRYVPTRFLTPFFSEELAGVLDSARRQTITMLCDRYFDDLQHTAPYRFLPNSMIEFHPSWLDYMEQNLPFLEGFCIWKLVEYLETRNPNVPNIQQKLFPPENRKLHQPRKLIEPMVHQGKVWCVYSGTQLKVGSLSVDHFIPWSFVVHDQLWNLVPTQQAINSAKSDNLPSLSAYRDNFTDWHFRFFHQYAVSRPKKMEDYSIAFNESLTEIATWEFSQFSKRLEEQIAPMLQVAENMGFPAHWTY
jgi:hypothetical protein